MGTWEHMAVGIPMVLSNGIAGMTFAGGKFFRFLRLTAPCLHYYMDTDVHMGNLQPTLVDFLATPPPKCSRGGIKLEYLPHSSVLMRISILSAGSRTSSKSHIRALSEMRSD